MPFEEARFLHMIHTIKWYWQKKSKWSRHITLLKGETADYCLCTGNGASVCFAAATAAGEKMEDAATAFRFFCQFLVNALESPKWTKLAA